MQKTNTIKMCIDLLLTRIKAIENEMYCKEIAE